MRSPPRAPPTAVGVESAARLPARRWPRPWPTPTSSASRPSRATLSRRRRLRRSRRRRRMRPRARRDRKKRRRRHAGVLAVLAADGSRDRLAVRASTRRHDCRRPVPHSVELVRCSAQHEVEADHCLARLAPSASGPRAEAQSCFLCPETRPASYCTRLGRPAAPAPWRRASSSTQTTRRRALGGAAPSTRRSLGSPSGGSRPGGASARRAGVALGRVEHEPTSWRRGAAYHLRDRGRMHCVTRPASARHLDRCRPPPPSKPSLAIGVVGEHDRPRELDAGGRAGLGPAPTNLPTSSRRNRGAAAPRARRELRVAVGEPARRAARGAARRRGARDEGVARTHQLGELGERRGVERLAAARAVSARGRRAPDAHAHGKSRGPSRSMRKPSPEGSGRSRGVSPWPLHGGREPDGAARAARRSGGRA